MDNAANKDLGSFTGHIDDSATGLTYMQARYYDPTIVRFLSIDPVGFQVEDPYMFNRYAYVGNNPVNLTDPFGLDADDQDEKKGDEEEEEIEETEVVAEGGDDSPWLDYFIAAGLIGGDILLGGPTGEGIAPAAIILGAKKAAKKGTVVIGRVKDLKKLKKGEKSLLSRLPDQGSPKTNWKQNSGVLRQEMAKGKPIRDASPGDTSGQFLNAERGLLESRGWTFDKSTNLWSPPK
ncbi:RHS repeat-associated core domain-containing protein [Exilibacterium tricleocarpae]|uniref:RHS repeat-associated core domain-containing protein n=1 Tax=Exilibacterium tricleocarpae TaxID=2591008 RepID=UPI0015D42A1E|nr:RHS repeat-associated core domain-containing protein [Exilibacterium tricleocarpae]